MKRVLKSRNGLILRVGSTVTDYHGDKCYIYGIEGEDISIERICDGISWGMVSPSAFGAKWA